MNFQEIKESIRAEMPVKRYEHTLGVEYTAACLAMRYGTDVEQARLAGLLHDCAKYIPASEKIRICEEQHLGVSAYERKNPELLHAKLGAYLAEMRYNIHDQEILSSIVWHTTGRPGMSLLEKIIFIADYMEPNRNHAPNLGEVRKIAFEDLDICLRKILEDMVIYLESSGFVTDPMTRETLEFYRSSL